jgi:hypothetical protein
LATLDALLPESIATTLVEWRSETYSIDRLR